MRKTLPIHAPQTFQRYDCISCAACCRGRFGINVTSDDHDRILAQGWTCDELGIPKQKLVKRHGDEFKLAHRPDGSCVFLQDDGLCRIHARYGEAAKPFGCRMYPFRLIPVGNQIRADIRFDCPPVASNSGRPVPSHRAQLQDLLKLVTARDVEAKPPPFFGSVTLAWPQLLRMTGAIEIVLTDVSLDITRRIVAIINMIALIKDPRVAIISETDFGDYLDELVSAVKQVAIEDSLARRAPHQMERIALRHILGIYGRTTKVGEKPNPFRLLWISLRMLAGSGSIPPLRDELSKSTFEDTEKSLGIPMGEAALTFERYLQMHLTSMGFFGRAFYERSYIEGLNALILTYPLLCWFSRAIAAAEGQSTVTKECAEKALMIVDHQHGLAPKLISSSIRPLTLFLSDRAILRSLAIWYGS